MSEPEHIRIIAQIDSTLSFLRKNWLDSTPKDRSKWMEKLNEGLDERLKWMKLRDADT